MLSNQDTIREKNSPLPRGERTRVRVTFKSLTLLTVVLWTIGCATVKKTTTPATTESPAPTSTPEVVIQPSGRTITLAFVGDIMMGGSAAYKLKTEGPDSFFTYTAPLLKQADISMGNLEGPLGLAGKNTVKKKYIFLIDPSCALGLNHAGFKILTLANNHTMDFGPQALQSTLRALDEQGLKHAGAGMNLAEARQPAWFEIKGKKVAVLAYSLTYPTEFWAAEDRPGCAPAHADVMREDIQAAKAKGADLVFVCCHWGQEKKTKLRYYQPELAHMAIDAGADAVVCHHPHIWQGLEVYKGKPIAYAIGNFAFGTLTGIKDSGILYLSYDEKNRWVGGKIIPLNVYNYQTHFEPQPMKPKQAQGFFNYLTKLSANVDLNYGDSEFNWKAPGFSYAAPTPVPAALAATPTPDSGDNPNGSLPGTSKP